MKPFVRSLCLAVLLFILSAALVLAKGAPPKITISGPGLPGVIEVTHWEGLGCIVPGALFHVGAEAMAEPQVGEGYELIHYAWRENAGLQPFDRLHYYLNPSGGAGYVFYDGGRALGGHSEGEGKWYHATPLGDATMQQLLQKLGVSIARPLPPINLAQACWNLHAIEPGEHFDRATVSGPGLKGVVEITDPHGLSALSQPLMNPFWQNSWNVKPQFGAGYTIETYFKNGDAYLSGGSLRYHPHPSGGRAFIFYNSQWFAVSPEADSTLRRLLKSLGATLITPPSDDIASVTPDTPAPRRVVGQPTRLGFTIREPGNLPADADLALVYLSWEYNTSSATVVIARPDGNNGHYSAMFDLPKAGRWYWSVVWGPFNKQVEMAPLSVLDITQVEGSADQLPVSDVTSVVTSWPLTVTAIIALGTAAVMLLRKRARRT